MKLFKTVFCAILVFMLCASPAYAAFESQLDDVESICDIAVEYVNSGSKDVFTDYMSDGIGELFDDGGAHSDKFVYLFEQDPELTDKENNQLSKIVAVIGDIYVNGGTAELTDADIDKNVIPDYGVDDYEDDDAEAFMEVINDNKAKLKPAASEQPEADENSDAMPPEKNNKNEKKTDSKNSGGASVGVVIFISIIVSAIVFFAGTYALRQMDTKKRSDATDSIDDDDIFNLRLAVKSMQTSLQKADGNFRELDKLRIQVDEMDEKLEHITEYLRKLNKAE